MPMINQKSNIMVEKKKKIAPARDRKGKKLEKEITSPLKRLGTWFRLINSRLQIWIYLIVLSGTISLLLFPNLLVMSKDKYSLGDVANKDIKASHDFLVEDKELTKQRRDEAVKSSLFVYDFDRSGAYTTRRIKESFSYGRTELERIVSIELEPTLHSEKLGQLRDKFFGLSGITGSPALFDQLVKNNFSPQIENSVSITVNQILEKGVVENKTVLMTQQEKGIILRDIDTQKELKVDDLDRFYDLEGARQHVTQIIDQLVTNEDGSEIAGTSGIFARLILRPNITFNKRETEIRKEEAKSSVKPIYFKVKKGEMIIREGEKINPTHLLKLEAGAPLKRNPPIPFMALSMTIIIGLLLALSYVVLLKRSGTFKEDTRSLIFISLTLLFMFLVVFLYNTVAEEVARGFYFFTMQVLLFALPISLGAILVSIFQGLDVAIAFSLIISTLASIVIEGKVEFFLYFLISSLLAAYGVRNCRERRVLIRTGMRVGLLNIIMPYRSRPCTRAYTEILTH